MSNLHLTGHIFNLGKLLLLITGAKKLSCFRMSQLKEAQARLTFSLKTVRLTVFS